MRALPMDLSAEITRQSLMASRKFLPTHRPFMGTQSVGMPRKFTLESRTNSMSNLKGGVIAPHWPPLGHEEVPSLDKFLLPHFSLIFLGFSLVFPIKIMETLKLYELAQQDFHELEILLSEKPEFTATKDSSERYLLHWAALGGRVELVKLLLARETTFLHARDDTEATPLILATLGGNLEMVKLLVSKGANITDRNWHGHSSLQYACSKGHRDIVEFLLDKGADVNVRDDRSDTCLHRLASTGRRDIMEMILKTPQRIDLNAQNREGDTPLHLACQEKQLECVALLVESGASVHILNKEKKSPLDYCTTLVRREILEKLNLAETPASS
ncbi:26S proteasome non-ATPase regulatory subunit 10-like [Phlebotomus argentipes]|uniref:26S proteasome non-ATPase regulatory subunit 10-like n=1 Tax=Phlebotomus argentipes TaxID=94469 RepID=UPI002893308D|nr:26S proteasome non-ATPase regulatory subunit 10-like [Phlebotomus argentipes]